MPEQEGSSAPAGLRCGPPLTTHVQSGLAAPLNTPSRKDPAGIPRHSLNHKAVPPCAMVAHWQHRSREIEAPAW